MKISLVFDTDGSYFIQYSRCPSPFLHRSCLVLGIRYVRQFWCLSNSDHSPSCCDRVVVGFFLFLVQKVSLMHLSHIFQYFFLMDPWFIQVFMLGRLLSLFPDSALGHKFLPDAVVMSANVVTWRYFLHLFSWCSILF